VYFIFFSAFLLLFWWLVAFAGCNQHFCHGSVCCLFVYQKSQLWQPGGSHPPPLSPSPPTPTPTTPTTYLWFCWNFQFNFPRCHFTLFALTSFLSGFQLPFISPVFFFLMHDKTHLTDDGCTYTNQSRTQILVVYPPARIFACNAMSKRTRCSFVSCFSASRRNWSVKNFDTSDCALWRIGAKKERIWQGLAHAILWSPDQLVCHCKTKIME